MTSALPSPGPSMHVTEVRRDMIGRYQAACDCGWSDDRRPSSRAAHAAALDHREAEATSWPAACTMGASSGLAGDPIVLDAAGCKPLPRNTRTAMQACAALGLHLWSLHGVRAWATGPDGNYHLVTISPRKGKAVHLCNGQEVAIPTT